MTTSTIDYTWTVLVARHSMWCRFFGHPWTYTGVHTRHCPRCLRLESWDREAMRAWGRAVRERLTEPKEAR